MRIRPYRASDDNALLDLWLASWSSIGLATPVVTRADLAARISCDIADRWKDVVVVEGDAGLLGFLALAPTEQRLDQLFVAPHAQGRGVGRTLLDFAKGRLPGGFWLSTQPGNRRARAFYEREGLVFDRIEPGDTGERAFYRYAAKAPSMHLVRPALAYLPSYQAALEGGWSPDNVRLMAAAEEQLAAIAADPEAFIGRLWDPQGAGPPVRLPDGGTARRLPGVIHWMWDGEFCGSIGFRWEPGTSELPPQVLGHIGYSVVPSKRGRGYATEALRQLLPVCRRQGLDYVEITTKPDNIASQKVILANGGVLIGPFEQPAAFGGETALKYRIEL